MVNKGERRHREGPLGVVPTNASEGRARPSQLDPDRSSDLIRVPAPDLENHWKFDGYLYGQEVSMEAIDVSGEFAANEWR